MKKTLIILFLVGNTIIGFAQNKVETEQVKIKNRLNDSVQYHIEYTKIKGGLPNDIQKTINESIEKECKSLFIEDASYWVFHSNATPKDKEEFLRKAMPIVANLVLAQANKMESPRWIEIKTNTTFISDKAICFRVFNARDYHTIFKRTDNIFLIFDLKTGRKLLFTNDLTLSKIKFNKVIKPYFQKNFRGMWIDSDTNEQFIQFTQQVGLSNEGLKLRYNDNFHDFASVDITIPWSKLKGKGILNENLIF